MKKSLLHIISFSFPNKLISVVFVLFAVNCSLLTVNCFSQWVQQTVPTNKPIVGIKFIDTLKGWAIASAVAYDTCYILHTLNGGVNWYIQYTSINTMYSAISFVDSNIIYAGGGDLAATANLTKTTNGGINWTVIPTPTNMGILDMQFLNKDSGWTCEGSIGPDVRTTTNGGLNWTVRTTGMVSQTQRIFFLNYNTGFCGANSFLYRTTNAGLNWSLIGNFSTMVQSIYFLNQNTGWIGNNTVYYTNNGGVNWVMQTLPPQGNDNVYDIYFLNNLTGYAGTGLNRIFKTTNSGTNWGYQIDTGGSYRISVFDSTTACSCWIGNKICRTINGGGQIIYTGLVSYSNEIPLTFKLYQNYPNPFNPNTKIRFSLLKTSSTKLIIYDVLSREVSVLANEELKSGNYEVGWDASNCPSGIYFYKIQSGYFADTKKMILLK